MNQWDIYTWNFPGGPHPAVVVSHPDRIAFKDWVNVLYCTSQRATRQPEKNEVLLDQGDGLDWETLCRCDVLYLAPKSELIQKRGNVSEVRQRQIAQRVVASFGWRLF